MKTLVQFLTDLGYQPLPPATDTAALTAEYGALPDDLKDYYACIGGTVPIEASSPDELPEQFYGAADIAPIRAHLQEALDQLKPAITLNPEWLPLYTDPYQQTYCCNLADGSILLIDPADDTSPISVAAPSLSHWFNEWQNDLDSLASSEPDDLDSIIRTVGEDFGIFDEHGGYRNPH